MLGEVIADDSPLPVVSAVHAKHIWAAFIGQLRAGRSRADHKNLCFLIHLRCRDRGVRAPVPDDKDDAVAYQLVCCGDCLIRIAEVVGHKELDLWPRTLRSALRSAAAIPTPRSNCSPNQAWLPVIGPATPIRISAFAVGALSAATATILATSNRQQTIGTASTPRTRNTVHSDEAGLKGFRMAVLHGLYASAGTGALCHGGRDPRPPAYFHYLQPAADVFRPIARLFLPGSMDTCALPPGSCAGMPASVPSAPRQRLMPRLAAPNKPGPQSIGRWLRPRRPRGQAPPLPWVRIGRLDSLPCCRRELMRLEARNGRLAPQDNELASAINAR